MLCIMAGHYPVFTATDEYTALLELIYIHGWDKVKRTADLLRMYIKKRGVCVRMWWRWRWRGSEGTDHQLGLQTRTSPSQRRSRTGCRATALT